MKTCINCGRNKPESEFYRDKSKRDGRRPSCKECFDAVPKVLNKLKRQRTLRRYMMKQFGLTDVDYDQMLANQNGVCAICHHPCRVSLSVDHDHVTNKLRGLLCARCNRGLGFFDDDSERLLKAKEYLDAYSGNL